MREQLTQYVNLLFAGTKDCDDIRQEILQNTLDRYDDLIAEGKVPEAAYRLAIAGIGDLGEILGTAPHSPVYTRAVEPESGSQEERKKRNRAIAIGLYIVSIIPLIALDAFLGMDILGLCITLILVAIATALLIVNSSPDSKDEEEEYPQTPQGELKRSIGRLIGAIGLVVYLVLSFATGMWYITWLVFPIMGAVKGLVNAIFDLKEAIKHEN